MIDTVDNCDRCVAQGRVVVTHPNVGTLTLCGHHYADNEHALLLAGFVVQEDTRNELTPA